MRQSAAAFVPFLCLTTFAVAQAAEPPAAPAAKAAPVFENGEAQVVDAFKKRGEWIREFLFVETEFDSDGDGKKDRMHTDVTRPKQTATEGLKVPVVYETSPYFAGTGPMDLGYYWDAKHEIGAVPPPRAAMKEIGFGKEPGMISQSEVGKWLPRGFAVVHSCSPGTGWSQGCPSVGGSNESLAPKAVIDWLNGRAKGFRTLDGDEEVKADWCTGKVGMIGTSYNGTLPVAAATTGVEGLEAIVPIAPSVSFYLYYRSNGLVRHPGGYLGEDVDVLYDFIASGDPKMRPHCVKTVRDELLAKRADRLTGDYNDFWAERDLLAQLSNYKAATLCAHGFNDWNVMPEHSIRLYAALKAKGVPHMAFFHQHGHMDNVPMKLVNRWFTRFLYGVDNGVEKDPKAWIVREDGKPSTAVAYADYPHPDSKPVSLVPQPSRNGVGELAMKPTSGLETIVDDVAHAGAELAAAEQSPHRLLWATPELKEPLHLSGTAQLRIKVASSKPAVNLSVWLVSLPWTGSRRITDDIVTRGWADPQNAKSPRESRPLVPGEFVELEFDLQPDDQILAAGERLGLMVFSSDRDFTLWPEAGTKLTVDLSGTVLTLPIVGGAEALTKATGGSAGQR